MDIPDVLENPYHGSEVATEDIAFMHSSVLLVLLEAAALIICLRRSDAARNLRIPHLLFLYNLASVAAILIAGSAHFCYPICLWSQDREGAIVYYSIAGNVLCAVVALLGWAALVGVQAPAESERGEYMGLVTDSAPPRARPAHVRRHVRWKPRPWYFRLAVGALLVLASVQALFSTMYVLRLGGSVYRPQCSIPANGGAIEGKYMDAKVALTAYYAPQHLNEGGIPDGWAPPEFVQQSLRNKEAYAKAHGYHFTQGREFWDDVTPFFSNWQRIPIIGNLTREFDWIVYLDTDTAIMRHDVPFNYFFDDRYDIIVAADGSPWDDGVNSGVLVVKGSAWSRAFFAAVYTQTRYMTKAAEHSGEQTVIDALRRLPSVRDHVKVVPRCVMNSKPNDWNMDSRYLVGDMLAHACGDRFKAARTKELLDMESSHQQWPSLYFNIN